MKEKNEEKEIKLTTGEVVSVELFNKTINKNNLYININLTGCKERVMKDLLFSIEHLINVGNTTVSHLFLAKQVNASVATVKRKLNILKDLKLISWVSGKNEKKMNTYSLNKNIYNELKYNLNKFSNMNERLDFINKYFDQKPTKSLMDFEVTLPEKASPKEAIIEEPFQKIAIAASAQYKEDKNELTYGIKGDTLLTTILPTVEFENKQIDEELSIEPIEEPIIFNEELTVKEISNKKELMKFDSVRSLTEKEINRFARLISSNAYNVISYLADATIYINDLNSMSEDNENYTYTKSMAELYTKMFQNDMPQYKKLIPLII